MKLLVFFIIGYMVLYITVWLHEVGHAIWNCRFGCKDKWYVVTVRPYIFGSSPMPLNMEAYQNMVPAQHIISSYGGVAMNAICALISLVLIILIHHQSVSMYLGFVCWMFFTLHLGEIFSYLFIGSIYPASDMAIIYTFAPKLRIPNIVVGMGLTAAYVLALISVPGEYRIFVIVFNVITVASMCLGRIVYSVRVARQT